MKKKEKKNASYLLENPHKQLNITSADSTKTIEESKEEDAISTQSL